MTDENDQEINKKLLVSILSRLEAVEKKNTELEAENQALKAEKETSKPKDPVQQAIIDEKKKEDTKKAIEIIRKNVPIGELIIYGIKKDLLPRQRSATEE